MLLVAATATAANTQNSGAHEYDRLLCWPVYYFLIFVLVVCSPLLLLSGRTTGYFAGQSAAVVEILQSSAKAW